MSVVRVPKVDERERETTKDAGRGGKGVEGKGWGKRASKKRRKER